MKIVREGRDAAAARCVIADEGDPGQRGLCLHLTPFHRGAEISPTARSPSLVGDGLCDVLHCSKDCVPAKLLAGDQYANSARGVAFRASRIIRTVARIEQVGLFAAICRPSGRAIDRHSHQDYPRNDCDTDKRHDRSDGEPAKSRYGKKCSRAKASPIPGLLLEFA